MRHCSGVRLFFALTAALVCQNSHAQSWDFSAGRWIDLSHAYNESTVYWPTADGFEKETVFEGQTPGGWYYTAYNIKTAEHGGTHIDAPIHFFEGRKTVDQIPVQQLIGPAMVIDISAQSEADADYMLTVSDLEQWESKNGRIPDEHIVLIKTGFASRWPNANCYMGTDRKGQDAVSDLHFPGIHPDAARFLATERSVSAVGIDTPSLDRGQSTDFMAHRILFEQNIPGFENLASLDDLPETGALVIALPMKITGGSGGPLRIVAFIGD